MLNRYIVIASPNEVSLVDRLPIDLHLPIIITGVGATNVINALKDQSKADVSVNIYAFLKAQDTGRPQAFSCAIGDDTIDGIHTPRSWILQGTTSER